MGWRFRQSFKIIPGLRLNLSGSGISASIGGAPFTINVGPRGAFGTASIPGTGISLREKFGDNAPNTAFPNPQPASYDVEDSLPSSAKSTPPVQEIRSASTEKLTSECLKEVKSLILSAYEEREDISRQFVSAKNESARTSARYMAWENGVLLKKIFKNSFSVRKAEAEIASARAVELEEQLRLTTVATQFNMGEQQAEPFFRMRDNFVALSECAVIWDIKSQRNTDKARERTDTDFAITRQRVKFSLGSCDLIGWEQQVPHLENANGGDIFLYPGFILYRAAKTAFSVIDFHDVKLTTARVRFEEQESVPSDSEILGKTWAKVNKDGSRDRRFANNFEIPIVRYGQLTFKSETGLWEVFHVSNCERLLNFDKSWEDFVASFARQYAFVTSDSALQEGSPASPSEQLLDEKTSAPTEVHFECHKCGQPIVVNSDAAGQEFSCPFCCENLIVPGQ